MEALFILLQQNGPNQINILSCLCSWIRSGSVTSEMIHSSNLVSLAFQVLQQPDTFDVAVDIACEIILASSRSPRNQALIETVYPNLMALSPFLKENQEDPEIVRGVCRVMVEAVEGYSDLITDNVSAFEGIIEGLLLCTSHEDLDIVKITINAWFQLSEHLAGPENEMKRIQFFPVFKPLVDILIKHMKYPLDISTMNAQERDEFREFRHDMGDVLKDCVRVRALLLT
jgi:transportin-3